MSKTGRKLIEIDLKQVQTLAAHQLTDQNIYTILGISKDTFYRRKKEFCEFSDALNRGRVIGIANIVNKAYQKALAGDNYMIKFFLERKGGWVKPGSADEHSRTMVQDDKQKNENDYTIGPALREFLESLDLYNDEDQ